MSYDTWRATDVLGDQLEAEDRAAQHADEDERNARYFHFINQLQAQYGEAWDCAMDEIGREYRYRECRSKVYKPFLCELHAFAVAYGWSSVLRALAEAMETK